MSIIEHLEELRSRLVISLYAIAIGAIAGWFLYTPVLDLLQKPYCDTLARLPKSNVPPTGCLFVFQGPVEPAIIKFKIVVFLGLFIALPVVLFQFWRFIVPGLTSRERKMAIPFVASSVVLFGAGALIAYFTLGRALEFLLGFGGPQFVSYLTASRYLSFVILVALAFGLSFEFPIVLIFLTWVGILSSQRLRAWRRYAILFIAVFAAVITPSQDPYTMFGMMVPMLLFYEVAILVTRFFMKR